MDLCGLDGRGNYIYIIVYNGDVISFVYLTIYYILSYDYFNTYYVMGLILEIKAFVGILLATASFQE